MAKYRGVARDEYGNSLNEASVTVYEQDGATLATIYSDSELATAEANPFSTTADGVYVFYADPGYYDIQVAKSGFTTTTLEDEVVGGVMAICKGLDAGQKTLTGSTPQIIGNTNLGATHLETQYVSEGFTVDVAAGTFTYDGAPTIQVEIVSKFVCTTPAGAVTAIHRAYRDKGGAREEIVSLTIFPTTTAVNTGDTAYGVTELQTGDVVGFYFSNTPGSVTYDTHSGSYYSIKRIG